MLIFKISERIIQEVKWVPIILYILYFELRVNFTYFKNSWVIWQCSPFYNIYLKTFKCRTKLTFQSIFTLLSIFIFKFGSKPLRKWLCSRIRHLVVNGHLKIWKTIKKNINLQIFTTSFMYHWLIEIKMKLFLFR